MLIDEILIIDTSKNYIAKNQGISIVSQIIKFVEWLIL